MITIKMSETELELVVSGVQTPDGTLMLKAYSKHERKNTPIEGIRGQKYGSPADSFSKEMLIEYYLTIKDEKLSEQCTDIDAAREQLAAVSKISISQYSDIDIAIIAVLTKKNEVEIIEIIRSRLQILGKLEHISYNLVFTPWIDKVEPSTP